MGDAVALFLAVENRRRVNDILTIEQTFEQVSFCA